MFSEAVELKINDTFKNLIPPLSADEYSTLEKSILLEGCREAIITWNDTIIDGHNRYEICTKHGRVFRTKSMQFDSEDEAKEWMILNQFGRRNISNYQRSLLALELEDVYRTKAKENQIRTTENRVRQISDKQAIDTKKELAKVAQVSHDTISKVKKIQQKAPEVVKQKLRSGEMSINEAYKHTKLGDAGYYAKREKEEKIVKENPIPQEEQEMINKLKAGEIVVINMNKHFHAKRYAEDNGLFVRIDRGSIWGNPFVLNDDGDRDTVCESYKTYLDLKPSLQKRLQELKGKALGCHCKPHRCHGDHLKYVVELPLKLRLKLAVSNLILNTSPHKHKFAKVCSETFRVYLTNNRADFLFSDNLNDGDKYLATLSGFNDDDVVPYSGYTFVIDSGKYIKEVQS